jgi:hypothetical protein
VFRLYARRRVGVIRPLPRGPGVKAMMPVGRFGQPRRSRPFVASGDSSFVNGNELFVNGGLAEV